MGNGTGIPAEFWDQLEIKQACRQQHFGYLLKAYRELQDPPLKQAELADILGITQGQVSRIERSKTPPSNLQKLARWAKALDIPREVLWFNIGDSAPKTSTSSKPWRNIEDESTNTEGDDMHRRSIIKSIGVGAALLGSGAISEVQLAGQRSYTAVGMESVEIMREWTQTFRRVDNRFGGGHSLTQIGHYISSEVEPKLRDGRCNNKVRFELFSAAAELYQLAGWMSYDVGNVQQGRKCLSRALRLCQEAGNHLFAAELWAGMSHQASFQRKPDDAVDFALAAKDRASKSNNHALLAEAAVMEAHGLAQLGDKRASIAALQEAETEFCRIRKDATPDWMSYFDEAYLSAKFGHTLKDLGEAKEAERFARRSLQMSDGYDRGRMFNTALLACTLADQDDVEQAASTGALAVQMAGQVRSVRTTAYLSDVAMRLRRHEATPAVQQLFKRMTAAGIPLQRVQ